MQNRFDWQDWLGIAGSLGCLVHCLALPVIVGILAMAPIEYPWLEWLFLTTALFAAFFAIRFTKSKTVRFFFLIGLTLFLIAPFAQYIQLPEIWLHSSGAVILFSSHLLNLLQHHSHS
ncbi:MAG: MerC domain-containing protein [Bacteroidia bacterium]|nr:MerC domain-containing protein [Bacteroidia bacterium]